MKDLRNYFNNISDGWVALIWGAIVIAGLVLLISIQRQYLNA
jgi:hypothetical protein